MKIGYAGAPTYGASTTDNAQKAGKSADAGQAQAPQFPDASEGVSVSNEARSLAAKGSASFDHARVERLRSARSNGELSLDVTSVAKRLEEEN